MIAIRVFSITPILDGTGRISAEVAVFDGDTEISGYRTTLTLSLEVAREIAETGDVAVALSMLPLMAERINPAFAPERIAAFLQFNATAQEVAEKLNAATELPLDIPMDLK